MTTLRLTPENMGNFLMMLIRKTLDNHIPWKEQQLPGGQTRFTRFVCDTESKSFPTTFHFGNNVDYYFAKIGTSEVQIENLINHDPGRATTFLVAVCRKNGYGLFVRVLLGLVEQPVDSDTEVDERPKATFFKQVQALGMAISLYRDKVREREALETITAEQQTAVQAMNDIESVVG